MLGPTSSPTRDFVFPSDDSTGHSSHADHAQDVLYVLAQVGAPDSDTGASIYRSSQWLYLFQDKGIHLYLSVTLGSLRQPQPPILSLVHPWHRHPPSKGSEEEKEHDSVLTYRVDERCGALDGHGLSLIAGLPGHATRVPPVTPHTAIMGHGSLAAAAVPMSHGAVIQYHWRQQE